VIWTIAPLKKPSFEFAAVFSVTVVAAPAVAVPVNRASNPVSVATGSIANVVVASGFVFQLLSTVTTFADPS
jgi:hypothetical protein